jgi:hypothetical protein
LPNIATTLQNIAGTLPNIAETLQNIAGTLQEHCQWCLFEYSWYLEIHTNIAVVF